MLLQGRDEHDPLFLQIKEATASVLAPPVTEGLRSLEVRWILPG